MSEMEVLTEIYPDKAFTAFVDRLQRRQRRLRARTRLDRERWIDTPAMTRQKNYDEKTEELRAQIHTNERTSR